MRVKRILHKMRNRFILLNINEQHIIPGREHEMMTVLIIGFILTNNFSAQYFNSNVRVTEMLC